MLRDVIQTAMEVELDEELGQVDIRVPRDRNGNFKPKLIGKYSRKVDGMEEKILALYACDMSQRDIAEQVKELSMILTLSNFDYTELYGVPTIRFNPFPLENPSANLTEDFRNLSQLYTNHVLECRITSRT